MLYRAAALFDGTATIRDAGLILDGERIRAVGVFADIARAYEGPSEDLGAVTVLPGIIDTHAHLMLDASDDPFGRLARRSDDVVLLQIAENGKRSLDAGITTVRDCGCREHLSIAYRQAVEDGVVSGPRVVASDRVVTIPEGHMYVIGLEATGVPQMREAVRRLSKAGADFIKLVASGGRLSTVQTTSRRRSQYSVEEIRATVQEAHALGMKVAVHAHSTDAIEYAADAGADSIEHLLWLDEHEGLRYSERAADAMASKGIFAVPTSARFFPEPERRLPPDELVPDYDMLAPLYARMYGAGVRFAPGGDTGASNTPFGGFVRDLELMQYLGVPAREVLASATGAAAECLGREDVGLLVPGRVADFITVSGPVLDDIRALRNVRDVFVSGTRVKGFPSRALEFQP